MCSIKKMFLEILQNLQETLEKDLACNFIKKESLAQVLSCGFLRTSFLQNTSGGCFRINKLWQKVSEQHNVKFKISVYLREEEACNNKLNVLAQCSSKDRLGLLCE